MMVVVLNQENLLKENIFNSQHWHDQLILTNNFHEFMFDTGHRVAIIFTNSYCFDTALSTPAKIFL